MRKIVDYLIVSEIENSVRSFERLVKQHIRQGWQPLGGVVLWQSYQGTELLQTMVKYEETL